MMKLFWLLLLIVLAPLGSFAQDKVKMPPSEMPMKEQLKLDKKAIIKIPSGASFYISPIEQRPNHFSILLSDADNRTVADSFSFGQIQVFEAVMVEAEKFAKTDEAAGTAAAPKVTRFVDKKEPSFIIDVEKAGAQSRFYVTLDCLNGHITVDAGAIKRDGKDHDTLFSRMLSRIQAVKPTSEPQ
ncbi:MAG: hypothetical protein ACLGJB_20380 [Blastocatellia bacterium]